MYPKIRMVLWSTNINHLLNGVKRLNILQIKNNLKIIFAPWRYLTPKILRPNFLVFQCLVTQANLSRTVLYISCGNFYRIMERL